MTSVTVQDRKYYINYHSSSEVENSAAVRELFSVYSGDPMASYFNGLITVPRDIKIEHFVQKSLESGNCDSLLKAMNYEPESKSLSGEDVVVIESDLFFDLDTYLGLALRNPDDGSVNSDRSLGKEVTDTLVYSACIREDSDRDLSTMMVRSMHDNGASCAVYRMSTDEVASLGKNNDLVVSSDMYSQFVKNCESYNKMINSDDPSHRDYFTWENILKRDPITDPTGFYEKYTNGMPLDHKCFDISGKNAVDNAVDVDTGQ